MTPMDADKIDKADGRNGRTFAVIGAVVAVRIELGAVSLAKVRQKAVIPR